MIQAIAETETYDAASNFIPGHTTNYLGMPVIHSLNELWQILSMCYNRSYLRNLICHITSENVLTIDHW